MTPFQGFYNHATANPAGFDDEDVVGRNKLHPSHSPLVIARSVPLAALPFFYSLLPTAFLSLNTLNTLIPQGGFAARSYWQGT